MIAALTRLGKPQIMDVFFEFIIALLKAVAWGYFVALLFKSWKVLSIIEKVGKKWLDEKEKGYK